MATFHVLSQYIWPDGGPDGLYAEQLAARLQQHGCEVRLVGGKGIYRLSGRARPEVPLIYLDHYRGRRGNLAQTRRTFGRYWDAQLSRWDRVVKIGANLAGPSHNSLVIRNWPTISFAEIPAPESKTALYLGNLGYGHDVDLFVKGCERLRDEG